MEGKAWEKWNAVLKDVITTNQIKIGKMEGSWPPTNPKGADHEYGEKAGRLFVTCMCILTLEAYYRHLPIYRQVDLSIKPRLALTPQTIRQQEIPYPELPKGAGKIDRDAPKKLTVTKSGLQYRVLRNGQAEKPKATATVQVNYHGWLDSG